MPTIMISPMSDMMFKVVPVRKRINSTPVTPAGMTTTELSIKREKASANLN